VRIPVHGEDGAPDRGATARGRIVSSFWAGLLAAQTALALLMLRAQGRRIARARAAHRSAAHQSREMSRMIGLIGHELRTPLAGVVGYADLSMRPGTDAATLRSYARTIGDVGREAVALLNDMLDYARCEAGQLALHPQPVRVREFVESCMEVFAPAAADKGIRLDSHVAGSVPEWVVLDRRRLGQVLRNIVANAVKFTESGGIALHVSATGTAIAFVVRDSGPGIDVRYRSKIFEAFAQGPPELSHRHGGSGLGLALVGALCALMRGSVRVESEVGHGSTFTVEIPLTDAATFAEPRLPAR
jgi:signal transduction histidine kinase